MRTLFIVWPQSGWFTADEATIDEMIGKREIVPADPQPEQPEQPEQPDEV